MKIRSEDELIKIALQRDCWKWSKIWSWAHVYQAQVLAWNDIYPPVTDDRRIFINTYVMVYEALESMSDNPPAWICCAINDKMSREAEFMDEILRRFLS